MKSVEILKILVINPIKSSSINLECKTYFITSFLKSRRVNTILKSLLKSQSKKKLSFKISIQYTPFIKYHKICLHFIKVLIEPYKKNANHSPNLFHKMDSYSYTARLCVVVSYELEEHLSTPFIRTP